MKGDKEFMKARIIDFDLSDTELIEYDCCNKSMWLAIGEIINSSCCPFCGTKITIVKDDVGLGY